MVHLKKPFSHVLWISQVLFGPVQTRANNTDKRAYHAWKQKFMLDGGADTPTLPLKPHVLERAHAAA